MRASRRNLLLIFSAAIGSTVLRLQNLFAQNADTPRPRSRPSLEGPDDRENSSEPAARASHKAMLEQRQKDIKKEVEKLYKLASELKDEVDKTDATTVLSLPLVRKAEEIEKLAKQIKENAKG
jgi:peptidoglycan hydrolase CwlO-like protein